MNTSNQFQTTRPILFTAPASRPLSLEDAWHTELEVAMETAEQMRLLIAQLLSVSHAGYTPGLTRH